MWLVAGPPVPPSATLRYGGFHADAFHAGVRGDGPGLEDCARRSLDGEAVGVEFRHAAAGHVEIATAVLDDVRGIDGVDAEIDGVAPRAFGVVGVDDAEFAAGGVVDVEVALVLAQIGRPDDAVKAVESGGDGTPVDEVGGAVDGEAGSVVEAGVGEVEVVADAEGAGVRMVAAEDWIAIRRRACLGKGEAGCGRECEGGGEGCGVRDKAAAREHGRISVLC
jgi:hypothetical protein